MRDAKREYRTGLGKDSVGRAVSRRAAVRMAIDALEERRLLATASGTIFYDANFNGAINAGEEGLGGWSVYADLNNNGVFDGSIANRSATAVPMALPDDRTTRFNDMTVSGVGTISGLTLSVNIAHTFIGDLDMFLISPSGTRVEISTDNGGSTNGMQIVFDDSAADPVTSLGSSDGPAIVGTYRPEQPLSTFAGQNADGVWRLEITDDAAADEGTLLGWGLTFKTGEASTTTASNGAFSLAGLPAGAVALRLVEQPNWQHQSTLRTVNFATATSTVTGQNFGVRQAPGEIRGVVFADYDADGTQQSSEPGIAGRTVYIDSNDNSVLDAGELSTVTNANGEYVFSGQRPGNKIVRTVLPIKWRQTSPTSARPSAPATGASNNVGIAAEKPTLSRSEIIVAMSSRNALETIKTRIRGAGLSDQVMLSNTRTLSSGSGTTLVQLGLRGRAEAGKMIDRVMKLGNVVFAAPNMIYAGDLRDYTPNDTNFGNQWHHPRIQSPAAWDITEGQGVTVAILDDGMVLTHPDIAPNLWSNTDEIPGNGIDDDGNGFVDDTVGWDFHNNDNNPGVTGDPHGGNVGGMTAARTNNNLGVAGIAGRASLMPIRIGAGGYTSASLAGAFGYAAANGAKITNLSYNTDSVTNDAVVQTALNNAYAAGLLLINSGGNGGNLNPTRLAMQQQLFVAGITNTDVKSSFSAWGEGMDLSAPATAVWTTTSANSYGAVDGTSFAAPSAAGVAALIWSKNPTWTRDQVAAQLLGTADNINAQNPSYANLMGTGRINALRAVTETLAAPKLRAVEGLPAEGSVVVNGPSSFTVRFFNTLTTAGVNNANAFRLEGAGNDDVWGTADDFTRTLSRSITDYKVGTNFITFTVGGGTLPSGNYRVVIDSTILVDPFGQQLDGNGDGTGGDSFVRNFTIQGPTVAANVSLQPGATLNDVDFGTRETILPTVQSTAFDFVDAQVVRFQFSEAMRTSGFTGSAVTIVNTTSGVPLDPASYSYDYVSASNTLRVVLAAPIANGNYTATLASTSARDLFGNELDGDANSLPGGDVVVNFNFLNADFDRNGSVGFTDLLTLSRNYGTTSGMNFTTGDADYDGDVDFNDLLILARNYSGGSGAIPAGLFSSLRIESATRTTTTPVRGSGRNTITPDDNAELV